jgi:hypothetical protein
MDGCELNAAASTHTGWRPSVGVQSPRIARTSDSSTLSPRVPQLAVAVVARPSTASLTAALRLQRLTRIQAAFGFPIKVLADVLQRSRTQIYKWLDAQEVLELQGESLQRLQQITDLAERWLKESPLPLSTVAREPLPKGGTIVDLMSADHLEEAAVMEGFRYLARLAGAGSPTISQQLVARGFGRRRVLLPDDDD